MAEKINDKSIRTLSLQGLVCSSAPMVFAGLTARMSTTGLFILQDADEAGYFYHDLLQLLGEERVLFFPSSYRRAVKYGQRDAASEILRTEVLSRVADNGASLYIVTYPEAIAEMVVSRKKLDERTLILQKGQEIAVDDIADTLRDFGFREVDYVYEPGQFAQRGSILDVYSYSCEYPFRLDFFGDEIDSIRTFEVENQLSKEQRERIEIVPELAEAGERVSFMSFLPSDTMLVMKDLTFIREAIERAYSEGFSKQAVMERMEEATELEQQEIERQLRSERQLSTGAQFLSEAIEFSRIELRSSTGGRQHAAKSLGASASMQISFSTSAQPLFHKNFELLSKTLEDYRLQGYTLYILALKNI